MNYLHILLLRNKYNDNISHNLQGFVSTETDQGWLTQLPVLRVLEIC